MKSIPRRYLYLVLAGIGVLLLMGAGRVPAISSPVAQAARVSEVSAVMKKAALTANEAPAGAPDVTDDVDTSITTIMRDGAQFAVSGTDKVDCRFTEQAATACEWRGSDVSYGVFTTAGVYSFEDHTLAMRVVRNSSGQVLYYMATAADNGRQYAVVLPSKTSGYSVSCISDSDYCEAGRT